MSCFKISNSGHDHCPPPRHASAVLLTAALLLALLSGCEVAGLVAHGLVGEKVPAQYELVDTPTLILVDLPKDWKGDPSLADTIAEFIGGTLIAEGALNQVVERSEVYELKSQLGDAFKTTPIDTIGQETGAKQVIYVHVKQMSLGKEAGMYRPSAIAGIKVVDTKEGIRLYPRQSVSGSAMRGNEHRLSVQLFYRSDSSAHPGTATSLARELAMRLGRDTAKLFYSYDASAPADDELE